ncbi:MAG: YetF domain-containing protein [Flavobacteriales bacterium]
MSDPRTLFLGEDHTWIFLLECALRAVLMFVFALVLMKITGKKEVRQFSVLELLVIIGLGSAMGDPMIYTDAPLLPSLVAIGMVLLCYWGLNKLTNRAPKLEAFVEGEVRRVFADGVVDLVALDLEGISAPEFFGDLRVMHVEHLGQVKAAYVEINGEISVFFHPDDDVRSGLPLTPEALAAAVPAASAGKLPCCCSRCGFLVQQGAVPDPCTHCGNGLWVPAASFKRVG